MSQVTISYSLDAQYYAIPDVRECAIWLSVHKHQLPVPPDWHRPGLVMACVMRGRDYYRICQFAPLARGQDIVSEDDDELVTDYRDAAWWTPGLEEAWAQLDGPKKLLSVIHNTAAPAKEKQAPRPQP